MACWASPELSLVHRAQGARAIRLCLGPVVQAAEVPAAPKVCTEGCDGAESAANSGS